MCLHPKCLLVLCWFPAVAGQCMEAFDRLFLSSGQNTARAVQREPDNYQPCSWFWLCSFTCSKFISFFRSTNQHARQDHWPDLSLHSSSSHMQDKELDPQKEQHLPSYMVCITHAGKHWGVFQQHMVSSVGSTVSCPLWQRHHRLTSHALLQDMLVGHCGEGWMLAARSVH